MELGAARVMATQLLRQHGLGDWQVVFDRAKTRAGVCRADARQIGLSAPLTRLHAEEEVRDTVLHEIAHALVGPRHGHDASWRAVALRIGCSALRCVPPDAPRVETPWTGTCPAGHTVGRHRRPERVAICRRCDGAPAERVFDWRHFGRRVPMHPRYVAELAALNGIDTLVPAPVTVGARVRVVAPGRFCGTVGAVVKRGRTRFHVAVREGVVTVPFAYVEPV